MFVYYSTKSQLICSKPVANEECPLCHQLGSLEASLYVTYMVIGGIPIPFLYLGKQTTLHCTSCQYVLKELNTYPFEGRNQGSEKLTPSMVSVITEVKHYPVSIFRRLWLSSLLILFILIPAGYFCNMSSKAKFAQERTAQTKEMLLHPQVGDIYKAGVSTAKGNTSYYIHVLVKVVRIDGNVMYVVKSKNSFEDLSGKNVYPYLEKDWDMLSRSEEAFESMEYAVDLQKFTKAEDPGYFYLMTEEKEATEEKPKKVAQSNGVVQAIDMDFTIPKPVRELGRVETSYDGKLKIVERSGSK